MRKVKLIALVLVTLVTVIILVQNTEPVPARILFYPVSMSLALLMVLTFALGFLVGILAATYFLRAKKIAEKTGPSR
jgi:ABC-type uncharacterized transport system permease subunit